MQANDNLVKDIINVVQTSDLGWTLKRAVQEELSKSFVNVKDIKRLVPVSCLVSVLFILMLRKLLLSF